MKERAIGFLLMMSIALVALPLLFGHNIPINELKLSKNTPNTSIKPLKSHKFSIPLPPKKTSPLSSDITSKVPSSEFIFEDPQFSPEETQMPFIKPTPKNLGTTKQSLLIQKPPQLIPLADPKPETQATPVMPPSKSSAPTGQTLNRPAPSIHKPVTKLASKKTNLSSTSHKTLTKLSKPVIPQSQEQKKPQKNKIWAVQVASFSDTIKAKQLVTQLQAKGFSAYTRTNSATNFTRVLVGPKLERNGIDPLLAKLQKSLNIQGIVVVES